MSTATDDRYNKLEKVMKKLGYEKNSLIEVLHSTQGIFGYLGVDTLKFVAKRLKLSYSKVYGVATFYNYFRLKPKGRHNIVVCLGTACYIKGSEKILQKIEQRYGIKAGETTSDEALSLLTARCFGSCSLAPVIVFDEEIKAKVSLENPLCGIEESIK
ncbi:MAG: NAD(P)H-dependent oxidoreductase subunit E [Sulfurimonas sp.]|uniref:NAD(P)H-dependent oxidoreductase subunit E n=1 Tax=Sulfurimonas sp. TaxID=2022749 RepID=UPI0025CBDEC7|nr:NAD(P)H-dependent oxidoreductase subunit E [Sulfurimonas sp.]MCK9455505.1 NAD(P)H-dependent oxidoreductase subunit E [Sulfurimonas sp.]